MNETLLPAHQRFVKELEGGKTFEIHTDFRDGGNFVLSYGIFKNGERSKDQTGVSKHIQAVHVLLGPEIQKTPFSQKIERTEVEDAGKKVLLQEKLSKPGGLILKDVVEVLSKTFTQKPIEHEWQEPAIANAVSVPWSEPVFHTVPPKGLVGRILAGLKGNNGPQL